jgi:RNA polymerase sporulation-specific sigma factor
MPNGRSSRLLRKKIRGGKRFTRREVERAIDFVSVTSVGAEFGISQELSDDEDLVSEVSSSSSEDDAEQPSEREGRREDRRDLRTVFDVDAVDAPLVGTPAEVRKDLDALALRLQRRPRDQVAFLRIVCYMHKYILGLVFRKYSFVRGHDDKDIYQEALIALFKKAVPSFRTDRGMSFLNFAKMCINRHLITILNASRNRRKDMPLNTSISLDHAPAGREEDDESCLLSNVVPDKEHGQPPFTEMARSESLERTLSAINSVLSEFERAVLSEYLKDKSYRDASKAVSKAQGKRCNERSIDNALLRIRKKALALKGELGDDDLPLVFGGRT